MWTRFGCFLALGHPRPSVSQRKMFFEGFFWGPFNASYPHVIHLGTLQLPLLFLPLTNLASTIRQVFNDPTVDGCEMHHQSRMVETLKIMGSTTIINWWFGFRWPIHQLNAQKKNVVLIRRLGGWAEFPCKAFQLIFPCLRRTSPNYGDIISNGYFEMFKTNPQKGTFTNPCELWVKKMEYRSTLQRLWSFFSGLVSGIWSFWAWTNQDWVPDLMPKRPLVRTTRFPTRQKKTVLSCRASRLLELKLPSFSIFSGKMISSLKNERNQRTRMQIT